MKEYPKAWIEALRSGKYRQGHSRLRWQDRFCCLGVRCDLQDNTKWDSDYRWDGNGGVLPDKIHKLDEFAHTDKNIALPFRSKNQQSRERLSNLNDAGFTFDQLADLIECFWEVL